MRFPRRPRRVPTANCRCSNTIFHHFETRFHRQTVSPRYPPLFCFHYEHQIEVGLDADVSGNILPFESPSINNFSGIDISQGLDREFLSLSPYFLLLSRVCDKIFYRNYSFWYIIIISNFVIDLYLYP